MTRPPAPVPAPPSANDPSRLPLLLVASVLAASMPSLLAFNVSPSPTFWNQALALGLWGGFVLMVAAGTPSARGLLASRHAAPVQAALALLGAAAVWSGTAGSLPSSLHLSSLGLLGAAALLVHAGAAARSSGEAIDLFALFCWGWLVAGLLNLALALVQVFAPAWPDGDWIAVSNIVGRAVGNLRQPNHLSSLLLWSAIATVTLLELRRIPRWMGAAVVVGMVFGVVLTASRTGLVSVFVLALWGLMDRRMSKPTRALLLATPLVYAAAWFGMARWAEYSQLTFGGAARLAESDVSGSRFGIWANTLALIRMHPWTGVGLGEFNLAWSLTPFPGRPIAFFDHTHNLVLQFAVELGLPLAALVMGLLLWGWGRMALRAWRAEGDDAAVYRAAGVFVLMIGLHSQLEYPLWYAYFLLPAAWAFGFGMAPRAGTVPPPPGTPLLAPAGAVLTLAAAFSVWDYGQVVAVFSAADDAPPLARRIERGQHSVFFAHHADYAAATTATEPRLQKRAFDGATHYLLDTRLMMAWADELNERGDVDRARHIADRLREFKNPASKDWFAECGDGPRNANAGEGFQCKPAEKVYTWQDFVRRR